MDISLDPELEKFVAQQVESGRYESAGDVVAAAITHMMRDERLVEFGEGELGAQIAEAEDDIRRGDVMTLDEVREHFRARMRGPSSAPEPLPRTHD